MLLLGWLALKAVNGVPTMAITASSIQKMETVVPDHTVARFPRPVTRTGAMSSTPTSSLVLLHVLALRQRLPWTRKMMVMTDGIAEGAVPNFRLSRQSGRIWSKARGIRGGARRVLSS